MGKPHPAHDLAERLQLRPAPAKTQRRQKCVPCHPIGRGQIGKQPRVGAQLERFAPSHKSGFHATVARRPDRDKLAAGNDQQTRPAVGAGVEPVVVLAGVEPGVGGKKHANDLDAITPAQWPKGVVDPNQHGAAI